MEGKDGFMKENEQKERYGKASNNDKLDGSSTSEEPVSLELVLELSSLGPQDQKSFTPSPKAALAHR